MQLTRIFIGLMGLLLVQPTLAADAEAGKATAKICVACHGTEGVAVIPGYPSLKGQNEQYLISSMKAYKDGSRTGAMAEVMKPHSMMLSDEDIANLAAYYSQLK